MSSFSSSKSASVPPKAERRQQLKHLVISQAIEQEIADGIWAPGARLPTEAQFTERFGVSRITVRRALQGLIQEGVLVAQQGSGTFVNPSFMSSVSNILFIHAAESEISYPYTAMILDGVRRIADTPPISLRIQLAAMPPVQQQAASDITIEEQVEFGRCRGVISLARLHPAAMERLVKAGVAVAMIGGQHFINTPEEVINIGGESWVVEALTFLNESGRQRIAMLCGDTVDSSISQKNIGKVLARLGIAIPPNQWEFASAWGANAGARAMERLLDRCPDVDAVIAADDLLALGALHTLWKRGRVVPGQVALFGIGNQLGEHSHCGISTIDIQLRQQGEIAAHSILQQLRGLPVNRANVVKPLLLHRATT